MIWPIKQDHQRCGYSKLLWGIWKDLNTEKREEERNKMKLYIWKWGGSSNLMTTSIHWPTALQSLTRVSISRNSREEITHIFLSRAGELYFHFSFSSRFWDTNSLSLLDLWDFSKQFSFSSQFSRLLRKNSLSTLDLRDFVHCFPFSSCEKCYIY